MWCYQNETRFYSNGRIILDVLFQVTVIIKEFLSGMNCEIDSMRTPSSRNFL